MKVIKIVFLSSLLFIGIFVFVNYDFNLTYKENQRIINYKRLIKASAKNDYDKAKYLLDIGTDLYPDNWLIHNYFTSDVRDTPIQRAAENGHLELTRLLIERGAIIDWCCCSCVTALHYAIINKHQDVVELLLDTGADIGITYDLELTVHELAKTRSTPEIVGLIESHLGNQNY